MPIYFVIIVYRIITDTVFVIKKTLNYCDLQRPLHVICIKGKQINSTGRQHLVWKKKQLKRR